MNKLKPKKDSTRIDKYLSEKNPQIPRSFFANEIKKGNILVNNKKINPSYKVKKGDEIEINCEYREKTLELIPQKDIPFEIIFESEDFLIINKPAGISVHPSQKEKDGTLVNGLIEKYPEIKNVGEDSLRPGIVHRLDKETAGLMIVVLNQKAFEFFKKSFKNRKIEKKYLALTWGKIKNKKGEIEGFIGKSKSNPLKQSFSQAKEKVINPKYSLSFFEVLEYKNNGQTLVEVTPKTGRMHQIRIHLHSIGHPIVGDKKYANKLIKEENKKYKFHQLKAFYLKFRYLDGKEYEFNSPS